MKQIVQHTLAILTPKERRRLGTLTVLDVLISILDILFLALLVFIIHFYTEPAATFRLPFISASPAGGHSLLLISFFLLLFSVKNLLGFLIYRAQCRFVCRVATRLSHDKLRQYQQGDYNAYINIDSAAHTRKISYEPTEFCQHIVSGLQQILTQTALISFTIAAMIIYNAQIFLYLFIILLPPVIAVFYLLKNKLRSVRAHAKTSIEKSAQYLQEAVAGFVESNVYDKNDFFLRRYVQYQQRFNGHLADLLIAQGIPTRMIEVFALLGLFTLVAIYTWGGGAGAATLVTIGAFMAAAYKIIPGIVKILNLGSQVRTYAFTIRDLLPVKGNEYSAPPATTQIPVDEIHSIRFEQVSFSYGEQKIVNNISFSLSPGDFLGIHGPSGKGKTTLLNLLLGFLTPARGRICINDRSMTPEDLRHCWPQIAYVRQQSFLLHDTLLHNVILDEKKHDEKKLHCALRFSGLTALIESLPAGLETIVAEHGKNFSGGQRQRIALARALYKKTKLIILDEPFSELDEAAEKAMLAHFQRLAGEGHIIILITHNSRSLSYCNKKLSPDA
ncbi:MAG: ABC transporter ATP-binding protein [Bacteroidetes bacterium]|nr:ABC transporter ATP-binding protein [Bacteroidota bacterium]